eukprot:5290277-Lingulodinium_polyedra.AAC.1
MPKIHRIEACSPGNTGHTARSGLQVRRNRRILALTCETSCEFGLPTAPKVGAWAEPLNNYNQSI